VSALIAGGPPGRIIERAIDGTLELVLPEPVLAELRRVLSVKLGWSEEAVSGVLLFLTELADSVAPLPDAVDAVSGDPDDDIILAATVGASVEALVTGDREHLLPLREHRGMRILTPQALLKELAQ
jgi:predicted nucleic acid-binding protein